MLDDPDQHLDLGPIPPDHEATVTEQEAIATTLTELHITEPALYVAHGLGYVSALWSEPVWLVIAKVQAMAPYQVGPVCLPDEPDCQRPWAVKDYAGAMISDTTGQMLQSFFTERYVPPPSDGPQ